MIAKIPQRLQISCKISPTSKAPQWRLAHHSSIIHRAPELSASPKLGGHTSKAHAEIVPWLDWRKDVPLRCFLQRSGQRATKKGYFIPW